MNNTKFAYFDPSNGRILQWIDTDVMAYILPDASMLHACSDAEWGLRSQDHMMVKDGAVAPYVAPAPDIAQIKAAKWEAIKAERDRRQLEGGVKVGDHWYLSTERAVGEYNSLINASQGMSDSAVLRVGWRTMDGARVDMTPALARQILLAGIAQRCAIDDAALTHKTAMDNAADPSVYNFKADWPPIFSDEPKL